MIRVFADADPYQQDMRTREQAESRKRNDLRRAANTFKPIATVGNANGIDSKHEYREDLHLSHRVLLLHKDPALRLSSDKGLRG